MIAKQESFDAQAGPFNPREERPWQTVAGCLLVAAGLMLLCLLL